MAWVFLTGDRAYKLKKSVEYKHRDCRFLGAREFLCREEVRLNRRLAPEIYLGVVPLRLDPVGRLALDGEGEVVDWLVVMKRLPEHLLLDIALARGTVTKSRVTRVADRLADFYRGLEPVEMSVASYLDHFVREQDRNREVIGDTRFSLSRDGVEVVLGRLDRLLEEEPDLLGDRVRQERIVEGHGDLRPEHVCLTEPPIVIDCLEFSRSLRLVDPFDELSFLGLECARLGAAWISEQLVSECARALRDRPCRRLLAFYTAYRACLRARLTLSHLLEPDLRTPDKWEPQAREYLALAQRSCRELDAW
ncbi:hypothetical protein HOP52_15805 [Halomonas campisalis]|uniref:Aminoglycoside phosphotransferase domain-containing protein n=1 Tax=Billgrantia campisalis TaxID=74661 RepID=A0ABS9PBR5_9GAMM|nr:hypothetical protein [Halomonas campisalis]MCG6659224.1 hypothetical protein [Halomonas campisalis]MDR5864222.1 hypothetical protein [Halomonas campisalis]